MPVEGKSLLEITPVDWQCSRRNIFGLLRLCGVLEIAGFDDVYNFYGDLDFQSFHGLLENNFQYFQAGFADGLFEFGRPAFQETNLKVNKSVLGVSISDKEILPADGSRFAVIDVNIPGHVENLV